MKTTARSVEADAPEELLFGLETNQIPGSLLAMQMSTIAYCKNRSKTMKHYLPSWKVVWEATHEINGQSAFVASNNGNFVVAIRGSVLNFSWTAFYNWFYQDFNVFYQEHWAYKQGSGTPMISKGSSNGLNNLNSLVDANGDSLAKFLTDHVGPRNSLCITGHSLGANLATVLAPYINWYYKSKQLSLPRMSVMTFAAATAGNKDFADEFDALFPNSWRFYNAIDVVPHGVNTIYQLGLLYPPPAPAASSIGVTFRGIHYTMDLAFDAIATLIYGSEWEYGSYYTHTNMNSGSIVLNAAKKIYPVTGTDPAVQWWEQAGQQHATAHYLAFLGGTPILCQS